MMTGTMYLTAMRLASIATQKQSAGVDAASTGMGASEFRPNKACNRSACSVLVGRPVDGPPRWISQMTSGISTATARPMASVFSAMPGPEVVVIASAPAYAGALAITTTSGPGMALKTEAMGLAVAVEIPLVICDIQRGGPSTGLPTKTEQADLLQALFGRNS